MTARSRHDELRALAERIEKALNFECDGCTYNTDGSILSIGHGCALHGEGYFARGALRELLDELAAAEARAEKAEQALREARQFVLDARPLLGISYGKSLGGRADRLYVAIQDALAAAAGDTDIEGRHTEGEGR